MVQTKYPRTFKVIKFFYAPMIWFFEKTNVDSDHYGRTFLFLTIISLLFAVVLSYFQSGYDAMIDALGVYSYMLGSLTAYSLVLQERDAIYTKLATENEPPEIVKNGY